MIPQYTTNASPVLIQSKRRQSRDIQHTIDSDVLEPSNVGWCILVVAFSPHLDE